ncbi:porin family protein [uncultured Shewanella sp.]|uniref:outer membrane protein n=1 Tax=uncultured Shewanella sp. TaxID=173975 RepID=UPI00262F8F1F|nr:porin family protein [uncultured Shewanella sp.]
MKKTIIAAFILTTTCSASAIAQTEGFYLGGEFGRGQLKIADTSINEHANNYGIYAGYRFTNWFALEAKISKTADFHHNETIIESYYEYEDYVHSDYTNFKTEFSATSVSLTPTFYWQFNDTFSAFAKMGVSYTSMNIDCQIDNYAVYDGTLDAYGHTHSSDNYDGFSYTLGVGFDSALTESLTLRLSYDYTRVYLENSHVYSYNEDYYDINIDNIKLDTTLSQFSLGLHYTF